MQSPLRWRRTRCALPLLFSLLTILGSHWPFVPGIASPCQAEQQALQLTADKLFDPAHLVNVEIELSRDDWNTLRHQTRALALSLGKTPAERPFRYFPGNVTVDGVLIRNVGIRKKGFLGSLSQSRPSLKIKFGEFQQQQPIAGLDRLTLNNNRQDRSLASQYLCYRFFNETGTVACRCNHAKVTVNGEYLGIYSHVEAIKAPFLKARFGDTSGDLYEGTVADLWPDSFQRFELKTSQSSHAPLAQLADLLAQEQLDLQAIGKLLDLPAFVKFWATESLLGFWDGYTNNQNNFFIYRSPANSKLYFLPWGLDCAFTNGMPLPPFFIRPKSVYCRSLLANRLYRVPAIQQQYRETLLSLLQDHWQESKWNAEIDRLEAHLENHLHHSQRDFSRNLKRVRQFVAGRRKVIQKELNEWPLEIAQGPREPLYFKPLGQATATFTTRWFAKEPEDPLHTGQLELNLSLDGQAVQFKDRQLGIHARLGDRDFSGKRSATLVITGKRLPDDKQIILAAGLPLTEFRPSTGNRSLVQGYYAAGNTQGLLALFFRPQTQTVAGHIQLDQASTEVGAPVSGTIELQILKMTGGKVRKFARDLLLHKIKE
ncbi:MAG: CotH kinase family protein [Planctomycetota bacterium]|nr:CotH kinase family protein [Planctomycetota bacterium]